MLEKFNGWLDGVGPVSVWLVAMLGRAVWYGEMVRQGKRKVAFGLLALEAATAAFCGVVGYGLAEYLDIGWRSTLALVCVLSWLGPGGAWAIAQVALRRWTDKKET